ncbi:MAG TPA: LptF/LptG family permease [Puia sp.]|nr:LptF/LptG family permease [Puia sp.]
MLTRLFKKLDILIVKAFIGPFIAIFFVTVFVLDLQFFWLYIDDVVGKGIDGLTVGRLILYLSATLVPLALPLAVLLSSIMTLGNLGETFELVAIKSAGISLLRFMRPLAFVSLLLAVVAFFFNNNVLPVATLKLNTLKYDIIYTKPAFDIREGVFYDRIEGFVIKIGKKEKDDSTIRDVVIYEQTTANQDNVIVADSGKMLVTPDKRSLEFILKSGSRYQEKANGNVYNSQLVRMSFDTYKKVMDLTSFQMNRTSDSNFRGNFQGMTLPQLGHAIDSLHKKNDNYISQATKVVNANMKFSNWLDSTGWNKIEKDTTHSRYLLSTKYVTDSIHRVWATARRQRDSIDKAEAARDKAVADAGKKAAAEAAKNAAEAAKNAPPPTHPPSAGNATTPNPGQTSTTTGGAVFNKPATPTPKPIHPITPVPGGQAVNRLATSKNPPALTFVDLLPDSVRANVMEHANSAVNNARTSADQPIQQFTSEQDNLRQHEIAWHEKITLAVAVLVMFLIGAPLGSIIRKGGIGLPLVFAVVFFVIFFLLNNFGRKFVKEGVMGPIGGMWLATYILTPIGIFLTYKALHDSSLFNKEFYFRLRRAIVKAFRRLRSRRESPAS